MIELFYRFEHNTIFSEDEGWMLFSIAAIAEAVGWTLLIIGITLSSYVLPHNQIPVQIAGRIHGMLFLGYAIAAGGLYPNLHWSRKKAIVALGASVVPYGSLLFELWANALRKNKQYQICQSCTMLNIIGEIT